jgi:hypothetical protein
MRAIQRPEYKTSASIRKKTIVTLATPVRKENDVLTATRKASGKLDRKPMPL